MHANQFCDFKRELPGVLNGGIGVAERYIVIVTRTLLDNHREEILLFAGTTQHLETFLNEYASRGFPRISMDDALTLPELTADMWRFVVPGNVLAGAALIRAGERMLMSRFGGVCWLTEMHHMLVPFYQAYAGLNGAKTHAKCADLLLVLGEIMGYGQRHRTAAQVSGALDQHEIFRRDYERHMDMREPERFSGGREIDTVGKGVGTERYLCWMMGTTDIRDIQVFPRLKGIECRP